MKLANLFLRFIVHKYLSYRHLLQKYNAEYLQDFANTLFEFEFFLDICANIMQGYWSKHEKVRIR